MAETIPTAVSTIVDERQRWQGLWQPPSLRDPRWAFGGLLTLYAVLGFTVFGFNRSPWQMLFIVAASVTLDVVYARVVRGRVVFPLSAWISSCSLAILLNYSHGSLMPFFPVLICFAGKNILTIEQRHFFNPAMFAVATSLLIGNGMITASPAYQWSGNAITVTFFLIAAGLSMFVFRVGRTAMIVSFLCFYALQTALRAVIMRHHLPPEMLFIGTMTTPPFFLFTMYMITDPMTSPKSPRMQVVIAFCIAFVDLVLHLKESVFTFFYAALTVASVRFVLAHISLARAKGLRAWLLDELLSPARVRAVLLTAVIAGGYALVFATSQPVAARDVPFSMERVDVKTAGLSSSMSDLLVQVDPRLAHIAKWVMSVGDAVATGDVDGDGKLDLFLSNALKSDADRAAIYLNRSDDRGLRFERLSVPVLDALAPDYKRRGVAAGGAFVDLDSDGDDDLLVTVAFGRSLVLRNDRIETGVVGFTDVSGEVGFDEHTVSLGAVVFDVENDGDLDVLLLNATTPTLPDYETETPLNIFALPQPAYDGDRRMFRFMHNGWHNANNGGPNHLYLNDGGHFTRADNARWGLNDTRWSLAAVAVDFNHDGFSDLYIANDFGPDELYFNDRGERFVLHKGGRLFNSVGNDTYKGMNASTADFDRNGWLDVYISNVHQPLQSEGSLLWMVSPSTTPGELPTFSDEATQRGALNERRFGWGAAAADLDNDGWPDIVQANGMVDDRLDACIPDGQRKDYWYVSQKLMQSGPEVHTYADKWGDIRGRTIFPNEARRAYLNLGEQAPGHFVDVAKLIGIDDPDNSRGVLPADLDNDGDLDLVITNQHGPVSLYRNTLRQQSPSTSHFACIRPIGNGRTTPRAALGTVATLVVDGRALLEQSTLMGGFSAQREPALRFGLGSRTTAEAVEVLWTDGLRERFAVEVDRCIDVVQGTGSQVRR